MKLKEILEMPRSREYVFHTGHTVEAYLEILNSPVVKRNFWGLDSYDVTISVKDDKFKIEKSGYGRDDRCFWGMLQEAENGTDISGHFGTGWFSKINPFFIIILVLLILKLVKFDVVDQDILKFIETTLNAQKVSFPPGASKSKNQDEDERDENSLFYSGRIPPHTL